MRSGRSLHRQQMSSPMNATMLVPVQQGKICLSGKCQDDVECRVNNECPPLSSCINFRCQETVGVEAMMIAQLVKYAMASPARASMT